MLYMDNFYRFICSCFPNECNKTILDEKRKMLYYCNKNETNEELLTNEISFISSNLSNILKLGYSYENISIH